MKNAVIEFFTKLLNLIRWREIAIEGYVKEYSAQFASLLNKTDAVLKACQLPVPKRLTEFSYELKKQPETKSFLITVKFPNFRLPPSISVLVRPSRYCVITGKEKDIQYIVEMLNDEYYFPLYQQMPDNLPNGESKVGWTTRLPYTLYQALAKKEITISVGRAEIETIPGKLKKEFDVKSLQLVSSVEPAPVWSVNDVDYYERRLQTYIILTRRYVVASYKEEWQSYVKQMHTAAYLLPDAVWKALPAADFGRYWENLSKYPFPKYYQFVKVIPDQPIKPALMRQFFENLGGLRQMLVFALCAANNTISFEIGYAPEDSELVRQQLGVHFPGFTVTEFEQEYPKDTHTRISVFCPTKTYATFKTMREFHLDPYRQWCEVLTALLDDSLEARFEIWCKPFPNSAARAFTTFWESGSFRYDSAVDYYPSEERIEETHKLFQKKLPAWWINTTIWTFGTEEAVWEAQNKLRQVLNQYETFDQRWIETFRDEGNLVSLDELVSLAHFPTADLGSELMEVSTMKAKLPPPLYANGATVIGRSEARGKKQSVSLPEEVRDRHVYLVGKSGTGKSTLMETIVRRDIEQGFGVAVIDPHGDMIRHVLETMPEHRLDDCIYFNPVKSPVSLEILAAGTEAENDLLTDDLVTMFRRTSESWGDKMQAILQMTFQTLLRVPGSSFTDITRLLTDKNYRQQILAKINHPALSSFWENRFNVRQAEPILIRMDRLTTSGALRSVLTQHQNSLNFYDVIRGNKIFLADLSKGNLGESTSHLLGSIIVSQIQLAVMRQAQLPAERRVPFSLFADEVQNFTTGAFSTILSEARKYKLRLTIAHQFVSQLPQDIQKAVFGNVGTLVFFAMSPDDLGAARHELGSYESADVANLPKYHALCRPVTAARDTFSFSTLPLAEAAPGEAEKKISRVINRTQAQFKPPPTPVTEETSDVDTKKTESVARPKAIVEKLEPIEPSSIKEVLPVIKEAEMSLVEENTFPVSTAPIPKNESTERGNSQHRYLQSLVKRIAESHGFQATVEKEVFGGVGRIDVALENETVRIAVEISVTNEPDYEVQNIQKCLAAGFETVVMISADTRHLEKIGRRAEELFSPEEFSLVKFFSPEEFHSWMENIESESAEKQEKVKGFKVNVKLKPIDANDQSTRKKAISDVVFGSIKNLKKDDSEK